MSDPGREFLIRQIEHALLRLHEAVVGMEEALARLKATATDYKAYQTALVTYTRDTSVPYIPTPVNERILTAEPAILRLAGLDASFKLFAPPGTEEKPHKGKAWDFSLNSKIGVIRLAFKKLAAEGRKEISLNDVLEHLPEQATVKVDRGYLHRAIPRMVDRGEIEHVGRGTYRYLNAVG